ncbi:MAG: DUF5682 family protein [Bacteroidales bacterium]|nr:DUF5682 family protein [Bacteroidales bacterium]
MERVHQNSGSAEMIRFDLSAPVLFFPVRHHSPVCSYQLLRTIELYSPEIILIEGPENACDLIPVLTDDKTVLPAAIYYYYKDKKKLIDSDEEDYRCYYPFLYSSPEYNAMLEAKRLGIPSLFIDLPYSEILINTEGGKGLRKYEKQNYADDGKFTIGDYYKRLCEKTKVQSFDEFWEKYFEISGLELTPEKFIHNMYTYCSLIRRDATEEDLSADGTLVREHYMAANIRKAMGTYKRVLVVTGGFHTPGLIKLLEGEIPTVELHKIPNDCTGCFPAAYSYEAADALHGYASGMKWPYFYDCIFKNLKSRKDYGGVYDDETLSLLIKTSKEAAKKNIPVSIADVTAAKMLMSGLASLRGVRECGMTELIDGVTGALIKGEKTISSAMPLDILNKLATGDKMGHIGDKNHIPPLIADLEEQCRRFRLKMDIVTAQHVECALFSSEKGLQLSRLFHRLCFLETGFCEREKGPDLHNDCDRSRVREVWKYRRSPSVDSILIDRTTDGFTIEDACTNVAIRLFRNEQRCEDAAHLAVDCFLMGISIDGESDTLQRLVVSDGDFFSVGNALSYFRTLFELKRLYEYDDKSILPLMTKCFDKLVMLLSTMASVTDDNADELCSLMKQFFSLTESVLPDRRDSLIAALQQLIRANDKNPAVYGAAMGLLCTGDQACQKDAEAAMYGYLNGTIAVKKQGADYLKGLFLTARDIVFEENDFLVMTDQLLTSMETDDFMEILPSLRLAFSYFTPQEISETAETIAGLYKTNAVSLLYEEIKDESLWNCGREFDSVIMKELLNGGSEYA